MKEWMEEEKKKKDEVFRPISGRVKITKLVDNILHLNISFQTKGRDWHQVKVKINKKHFKEV
jgi:hypothetical protein